MSYIGSLLSVGRNWTDPSTETGFDYEPELRVTCFHDPPYTFVTRHANGSVSFDGYLFDIWLLVAEALRLRYRMVPAFNNGYGSLGENGTWNGMVGELAYGRADVALTWLFVKRDRAAVIDYIDAVSVSESTTAFYTYHGSAAMPALSAQMFGSLMRPLHVDVWWSLLAALVVLSGVLRASLRFNHERAEERHNVAELGWGSCLFSCFQSVMGQGWHTVPSSLAARIVTIFTWLLGIIISVSYTANLISYLTVVRHDPPLYSLRDFVERPDWQLAVPPSYSVIDEWRTSKDVYERRMHEIVVRKERLIPLDSLVEDSRLTLQSKVLTYIDLRTLSFTIGSDICSLLLVPNFPVNTKGSYMLIARNKEKLKEHINEAMSKINEAGIIQRLQEKWKITGSTCEPPSAFQALSFGNLLALMVIVPFGVITSVLVFVGEKAWKKRKSRRARPKQGSDLKVALKPKLAALEMKYKAF
ncbi:glutamate receptor 1-like [Amphibalanus amphitrite]|uniref:glutamate receptor 1-like n=1 Tax=Amphibalanus amphitrite TaxID=1232801 RepID=UPI001C904170|nr:glutamate receptor 1-like [Amphibalanus amphitrite]